MGYLTTFTIYNDSIDLLSDEKNAVDFAKKILDVVSNNSYPVFQLNSSANIELGNMANFCTVQKPRHADEITVYVHAGNTVVEVNPFEGCGYRPNVPKQGMPFGEFDKKAEVLYRRNKKFFKKILEALALNLKESVSFMDQEDLKDNILSDNGVLPSKRLENKIHQELLLESFKNKDNQTLQDYIKLFN